MLSKGWSSQQGFAHGLCQPPVLHPHSRHSAKNVSALAILQTCFFLAHFDFTPTNHPMFTFKKKNLDMCLYFALCVIPGKPPQSTWSCLFNCLHKLRRWWSHLCCCLETPMGPAVDNKVSLNWELPNPKILPCQHRLQLDHMSCLVGVARLGAPSGWRTGVIFRITSMTPLAHSPGRVLTGCLSCSRQNSLEISPTEEQGGVLCIKINKEKKKVWNSRLTNTTHTDWSGKAKPRPSKWKENTVGQSSCYIKSCSCSPTQLK